MDEQVKKIILSYHQSIENIQEALRLAQVPDPLVELYTVHMPDFNKLLPDDVVSIFRDVRIVVVLYLDFHGMSLREIAQRVGCSHTVVQDILQKNKPQPQTVGPEEVSQANPLEVQ